MPLVIPAHSFSDGALLRVEDLNNEMFTVAAGQGHYSTLNGGGEAANLDPSFKVLPEHLQEEQFTLFRADGSWSSLDHMSTVSLDRKSNPDQSVGYAQRQAVPGCGMRFYLPFDASAVRFNVSCFLHFSKYLGNDGDEDSPAPVADQDISMALFLDGSEISQAYRRTVPPTLFTTGQPYQQVVGATSVYVSTQKQFQTTEAEQSTYMDLSFVSTSMTTGFHEIYLGFYVSPLDTGSLQVVEMFPRYSGRRRNVATASLPEVEFALKNCTIHQRLSFGCRNARVVAFR